MRGYMRDPDGYLIEVGQTTVTLRPLSYIVESPSRTAVFV
jgi:hypothetical protein